MSNGEGVVPIALIGNRQSGRLGGSWLDVGEEIVAERGSASIRLTDGDGQRGRTPWTVSIESANFDGCCFARSNTCLLYTSPSPRDS